MREIEFSAEQLTASLLAVSKSEPVCILDSCGVSHLGSHLLIAGLNPSETLEITETDAAETLRVFERKTADAFACIFTISYEFGLKLNGIEPRPKEFQTPDEPDVFLAAFENLIVHDYDRNQTFLIGNAASFDAVERKLRDCAGRFLDSPVSEKSVVSSNFTRAEYLAKIEEIKEFIRRGDTYQTNLTQHFKARLPENLSTRQIFCNLRKNHPAPFAAFLKRKNDTVVSASPERFFRVESEEKTARLISVSPIKGTRPRGRNADEDDFLKNELLTSAKDLAENVMIVDLLRNDLGRICEFGSVAVEKLCDLETHPTLFHLVSTVNGRLRETASLADIIRAVFPCGSITGAPKISTMRIIDRIETADRGLSMGAIGMAISDAGFQIPDSRFQISNSKFRIPNLDLSVAIRTMTISGNRARFNVGGGIVIDSNPEEEYEETLVKAKALLDSINGNFS